MPIDILLSVMPRVRLELRHAGMRSRPCFVMTWGLVVGAARGGRASLQHSRISGWAVTCLQSEEEKCMHGDDSSNFAIIKCILVSVDFCKRCNADLFVQLK